MDISLCGNRCLIALQVGVDWTSSKHPLYCNRALLASQVTADWNPGVGAPSFLWSPAVSEEGVARIRVVKFFPFLLTCVTVCFLKRLCACVQSPAQTYWLPAFIGKAESPVSMVPAMFSGGGASGCVHCFLSCPCAFSQ